MTTSPTTSPFRHFSLGYPHGSFSLQSRCWPAAGRFNISLPGDQAPPKSLAAETLLYCATNASRGRGPVQVKRFSPEPRHIDGAIEAAVVAIVGIFANKKNLIRRNMQLVNFTSKLVIRRCLVNRAAH